ncbi:MAG TPA: hypothetical protein PLM00_01795 [Spirochaetota bacterium]|nr:hypothetical protein [Spirochaetota bacterium]HPH01686.1 hypothetical protein [Spirochaetota bacterium]HPN82092.1 hypothetical protein [Spirochaetota bacterium]
MVQQRIIAVLVCLLIAACSGETKPDDGNKGKNEPQGILRIAKFEFRLEDTDPWSESALRTVLGSGERIRLRKEILFSNDDLVNAYLGYDEIFEATNLWLIFSPEAGKRLKEITGKNVGKRLAIMVDGDVWIAPRILQEIPEGKASISGKRVEPYINRLGERLKQIVQ